MSPSHRLMGWKRWLMAALVLGAAVAGLLQLAASGRRTGPGSEPRLPVRAPEGTRAA